MSCVPVLKKWRWGRVRSPALQALAFHGEEVEPPHSCGVSNIPLFP
ncbi:hypothetical protein QU593_21910 [Rossellomorea marisflavi]|nr:hypothetical protein [Rossellomorea marisflavi]WJV18727.1 hypothetical protein QU593_21910 [Rossellomorea marisflavi]